MAGTTSKGFRYPSAGDNPAVHTDIQNLATDVDGKFDSYALLAGPTFTSNIQVPTAVVFEGATNNAYETTLTVVDPTGTNTITMPDTTGTIVIANYAQTLTNKTLTSPTINGGTLSSATITSGTLGNALAAGTYKITGLGDAAEGTDTDAVNVKSTLNLARTTMLMLGGM
jgi:hypothetical protein